MGKRSEFKRKDRDFYPTPIEAVYPLIPYIINKRNFAEPCAGDGRLSNHLGTFGLYPYFESDILPLNDRINKADALVLTNPLKWADCIITNPPWDRKILHKMIEHFIKQNDCVWLLFDADWPHTKQSAELIQYCDLIVPIGRVKWIEGSKSQGKDNCCWYRFRSNKVEVTHFTGRF